MLTAFSAAIFCALFFPPPALAAGEEFNGVKKLELHVASGDVSILGTDGETSRVSVVKKRYDERCRLTVEQRGEQLFVELKSKSLYSARCEADFELQLPRDTLLSLTTGSGKVTVRESSAPLVVSTGSGRVDAEGLKAPATVKTGSGRIRLVYSEVPSAGTLELRSGSGDAEVLFPKRAKVKTTFRAGSGSLRNRLGDSRDARFSVVMKSGSGDLTVGKF